MTQIAFLYTDMTWDGSKNHIRFLFAGMTWKASFTRIIDIFPSVATHPSVRPYSRFILIRLARGKVGKTACCPYNYFLQHIVSHTQIIACARQQIPFPPFVDSIIISEIHFNVALCVRCFK